MKKKLLFSSMLMVALTASAQYPINDFENWTTESVQTLDDYESTVNDRGIEGALSVYSVTDRVSGALAIKLETILGSEGDTIFGYFISGEPDDSSPGQSTPLNGVDSIIGWYKYDIQANDSCVILIDVMDAGSSTGGGTFYFTGSQPTWKRFAYYVNAATSDSLLFAIATGDPLNDFNGLVGSWAQFDDIQLKGPGGTVSVLNSGFENWSASAWEELSGWASSNYRAIGETVMPARKITASQSGTYALELNTIGLNGDTVTGMVTNGTITNYSSPIGGVPFSGAPTSVQFYYKYAPSGVDNANVSIELKQAGSTIDWLGNSFNSTVSTFTLSSSVITATTADTLLITIYAGDNPGSVLTIDNMTMTFPVGINELLDVERIVSYPNPATDQLNIKFNLKETTDNLTIRLTDVNGRELTSKFLGNLSTGIYNESFNTSNYSSGVYFIEFITGNNRAVSQFIVK